MKENIHFMWLSAMSRPDHNTLNRFRSERLKGEIKAIFTQIVLLLEKEGLVSLETTFVDGTKIEANANRLLSGEKPSKSIKKGSPINWRRCGIMQKELPKMSFKIQKILILKRLILKK
ncbi:hypothetical protein J2783_003357 [Chryseobacterium sediminis]|nr:hypothetical protein [Chryseobacterium sediminis]